ncbi:PREDICTED: reticulocalbin-1-like [Sturnus vulgaris]|uniref:reticulocalbin-1-like n=1 Tax=Sturnus vulgaris TaxID=9172 RepID=UPI00071A3660|nr:PREDICTED: reticulocalbin-1-like [Sturnus vulgaris]
MLIGRDAQRGRGQGCEGQRDPHGLGAGQGEMLPAWLCPLGSLLALALGGPPQHPQPHFGGPQPPESHQHDAQGLFWDHAAIWGEKEAQEQQELPPEESKRRLRLLVDLMDSDGSGGVSRAELRAWILRRHRGARQEELSRERGRLDRDGDGAVTWAEFKDRTFGDDEDFQGSPDPDSHRQLLLRSRRRFEAADEDKDGRLLEPELDAFLHPEDFPQLQELVVQDGDLSPEEILGRWELFVGSRATDYGQDLHRGHDEL